MIIPKIVKKIAISKLRIKTHGDYLEVSTNALAELNITENEPFQIIDEGGNCDGKFANVHEFWFRNWQTISIISEKQAEFYFNNLFKSEKKKKEYDKLEEQSHYRNLNLKLTEQELFYIRYSLELGFKQMPQDDRETYDEILKMFQEK